MEILGKIEFDGGISPIDLLLQRDFVIVMF